MYKYTNNPKKLVTMLASFPFVIYTLSLSWLILFNRISELNSNILCRVKGGTSPPGFQITSHFPYLLTFLPFSLTICGNIPPPWKSYKAASISSLPLMRDIKTSDQVHHTVFLPFNCLNFLSYLLYPLITLQDFEYLFSLSRQLNLKLVTF